MTLRLEGFPTAGLELTRPVTIRWNTHAVPYIEAASDADAAYALGLVHAHLRGTQLQLLKRLTQGRLSELLGPFTLEVDHALRVLGLPRAAAQAEAGLAHGTRAWIDDFVRGLNAYWAHNPRAPEFRWLNLKPELFSRLDVLSIGRLAGADVNWFVFLSALRERGKPGFARLWQRILDAGGGTPRAAETSLLGQAARFGSNSVAVAASRSASGAPLLANDPHLGLMLPNFWVLGGLRSPSYRMVGLMPPGLPFVGVGAGEHGAWGGTNMRAASSDLVDVSADPAPETQEVRIKLRLLGSRKRRVRISTHGPILNDAGLLGAQDGPPVALRWAGYGPSDEIGAFLAAAQARDSAGFRRAFAGFAVSAQNIVFATRGGEIGKIHAARLPQRSGFQEPVLSAEAAARNWSDPLDATRLPMMVDPPEGYIVSANERPAFDLPALGFWFSDSGRAERLAQLAGAGPAMELAQLRALQRDTQSPTAARLARRMLELFDAERIGGAGVDILRGWNGDYGEDSAGAVAFEAALHALAAGLSVDDDPAVKRFHGEWAYLNRFLLDDVAALPAARRQQLLDNAARQIQIRLQQFPRWGEQHRLRIAHLLGALPWIGRRYRLADLPTGGSRDTPMKTSHGLVRGRHISTYGAQARHLSDLSDLDANYFVLLGGNDGRWGSDHFADQLALWRKGEYIRMPLRPDTVAAEFSTVTELLPRN